MTCTTYGRFTLHNLTTTSRCQFRTQSWKKVWALLFPRTLPFQTEKWSSHYSVRTRKHRKRSRLLSANYSRREAGSSTWKVKRIRQHGTSWKLVDSEDIPDCFWSTLYAVAVLYAFVFLLIAGFGPSFVLGCALKHNMIFFAMLSLIPTMSLHPVVVVGATTTTPQEVDTMEVAVMVEVMREEGLDTQKGHRWSELTPTLIGLS